MSGQQPNWCLKPWSLKQQKQWLWVVVALSLSHNILSPSSPSIYSQLAKLLFHRRRHGLPLEFVIASLLADG